jgi:hypothetical protein
MVHHARIGTSNVYSQYKHFNKSKMKSRTLLTAYSHWSSDRRKVLLCVLFCVRQMYCLPILKNASGATVYYKRPKNWQTICTLEIIRVCKNVRAPPVPLIAIAVYTVFGWLDTLSALKKYIKFKIIIKCLTFIFVIINLHTSFLSHDLIIILFKLLLLLLWYEYNIVIAHCIATAAADT